ncbi:hypothetical protein CKAH01_12564 [Colletotrichum kahawae]|uniref:Uncharacterized protein n=1 Tax=Colletotrichum kahawae TaxID=34407 RepID=A0AAE0DB25_COLKA|nr:hypothetical protein CKAH01_12564 [Colletotrichum kahawae]
MIIPTPTTNLTLTAVPAATFVSQTTGAASAASFASLGINEILTIAFGIVASLTAVVAVMIGCMQLKRARSPRPAGDRRVNAGDDLELRPLGNHVRAASAPPAPGRNSEGSTPPGSNRMKNG